MTQISDNNTDANNRRVKNSWYRNAIRRLKQWFCKQALFSYLKYLCKITLLAKQKRISNKASALTYQTLFAIVPFFVLIFGVARGLEFDDFIEDKIINILGGQAEAVHTIIDFSNSCMAHAKNSIIIGGGIIVLLWSIYFLLKNLEREFNDIWHINTNRFTVSRFFYYISFPLLLPIFIVIIGGFSQFILTFCDRPIIHCIGPVLRWIIKGFIAIAIFTSIFKSIPNTEVKCVPCIKAAVICSIFYFILQFIYIWSQIWLNNYNFIYGSFAALPLFMVWSLWSWKICLLGAHLTYCFQNYKFKDIEEKEKMERDSLFYYEFFKVLTLSIICKQYKEAKEALNIEDLVKIISEGRRNVSTSMISNILNELVKINLVKPTGEYTKKSYIPSIDINLINLKSLNLNTDISLLNKDRSQSRRSQKKRLIDNKIILFDNKEAIEREEKIIQRYTDINNKYKNVWAVFRDSKNERYEGLNLKLLKDLI